MLIYAHKDEVKKLSLIDVANEFVSAKEQRKIDFGTFF